MCIVVVSVLIPCMQVRSLDNQLSTLAYIIPEIHEAPAVLLLNRTEVDQILEVKHLKGQRSTNI